ncbi:iron-containing alcohol dehydrogenase [Fervidibacter sacchari]|uniref:Glycerol-1-phosphate dehydrogenase [NAD(P)+] n=1 Tax=Candidatus Fervidibacter sacchari TaxID=1448929 RepID=A0ABT2ELX1_9BACT|nr:iron-containing alcohol dehydrogenase [Candidatus Fervidibacter sacchari]MCS3918953.1 glycerol-1-phosphate dehydrogenase [NAD(P)+] [Candidatus Fervidibacter sacchari]WKU17310.1 iron-containing alcohol dehydrogenase [Candidatus Fervidibacter sacchari]
MAFALSDFLGRKWVCEYCGKEHFVPTKWVHVGEDAFALLHDLGRQVERNRAVSVVADEITWKVAGEAVADALKEVGCKVQSVILPLPLHATDEAANRLLNQWSRDVKLAFAVGSGTVNDLVKWAASQAKISYIAIPTAASMNGYTSPISALLIQCFKRTQPCAPPEGILSEPKVVASAPQKMTAAGYADLMSKTVADVDWQISNLLWGEHYCPLPRKLVADADEWLQKHLSDLANNEPQAVAGLLEALLLSGIGMTIAGSSTPSSGAEHLISHWLEMKAIKEGRKPDLHGLQVGVGTLVALTVYEMLLETSPSDWSPSKDEFLPPEERKSEFAKHYGAISERVLSEFSLKWLSPEKANEGRQKLAGSWEQVKEIVTSTWVPPQVHRHRLSILGAATHPHEISVSIDELREAILHSREIRRRWTVLDTAYLVGLLPDRVDEILKRCGWL